MSESPPLLVADSFRVRLDPASGEPEVRGFERHLRRFATAVHEAAASPETARALDAFLEEASERIADFGEGMPRLELLGGASPRLHLRLRPLPRLRETLELRAAPGMVLVTPTRKGPNIATLSKLNRELAAEALLVDEAGLVIEGATTAIVWWDADGGHTVASRARVPSVTEALLAAAAPACTGAALVPSGIAAAGLVTHEVWALNALHGIRVVTGIDGVPAPEPEPRRLARFREALDRTWRSVRHRGA